MRITCCRCNAKAFIKRPKTNDIMCRDCFFWCFEEEIHWTISNGKLITKGDKIAIGASGGKDSTVLAYVMKILNERHNYEAELMLLSIDEGITGYRDDSLETVKRNKVQYNLPLKILSYKDLYGWSMDEIVKKIGNKGNCTFCGVFRRQALDRGASIMGANKICTGHNADDVAETVIMNTLRGDVGRLQRCTAAITGSDGVLPRFKPFKYAYEKEIVLYAHAKKLDYFSTECSYAPHAYRGFARAFIKDLEKARPRAILDIISSGEQLSIKQNVRMPVKGTCLECGYISSQALCQACSLLAGLNRGLPRLGIGKTKSKPTFVVTSNSDSCIGTFQTGSEWLKRQIILDIPDKIEPITDKSDEFQCCNMRSTQIMVNNTCVEDQSLSDCTCKDFKS